MEMQRKARVFRPVFDKLKDELENQKVLILLGARQVGKSFLMYELENEVLNEENKSKFFNLELPSDNRFFAQDEIELYKSLTKDYIFIDEFHYIGNATKLFKAIYDDRKNKIKIIASGSSALEIHRHLKESLAGRKVTYLITPLNFTELRQVKKSFDWYLNMGGYPELIKIKNKKDQVKYLEEVVKTYILKDIKALIDEEHIPSFNAMLYYLAFNQGQVISANNLANEYRLNHATVERYLEILSQTYILHKIPSYASNLSNELKKSKKYYFYDMGIRNSIINNFEDISKRQDKGSIYEQYLCNFLLNNAPANAELRFWRTRNDDEIDFVYLKDNKPYIFEVKSKLRKAEVPDAMKIFINNYRHLQAAYVVNENIEAEVSYKDFTVNFIKISNLEDDLVLQELFEA